MTGQELRAALERLGISQLTAARWASINPRTMRRYVLGEHPVPGMLAELIKTWLAAARREGAAR